MFGLLLQNKFISLENEYESDQSGVYQTPVTSDQANEDLKRGTMPLPVYTLVQADFGEDIGSDSANYSSSNDTEWFEITPFEAGCDSQRSFVPTESLGRKFAN